MTTGDLDLTLLREPLENALRGYERLVDSAFRFSWFGDFVLTPDKPNTARTVVPVLCDEQKVGDLYVILFRPGDGTGDEGTFKTGDLIVPDRFCYKTKPSRVFPRSKQGVECEGYFPLFSMRDRICFLYAGSLDLLSPLNGVVIKECTLGLGALNYQKVLCEGKPVTPRIELTTGTVKGRYRFGDPHAIHYGVETAGVVQVAGFLSVRDRGNPLCEILEQVGP